MSLPTVAFLTVLPLEFEAVVKHLENLSSETIGDKIYKISERKKWRVVVRQQHSQGNYQAARETDWLIQHFQPTYLFFVGVAGGIKDVALGDVVVATLAKGYESVKVKDGVTYPRLHVEYSAQSLVEQASDLARNRQPKTWVCAIASGEKLVADETLLKELQQNCSDAVAVEMEAIGFLGSIWQHEGMKGIVIRGISDLIVGKNPGDDAKWQPIAARNAAAFAFDLLDKLPVVALPKSPTSSRVFYVPHPRTKYFTGRVELLQQMQEQLEQNKIIALHGLGGIGKTQTLVEYAHQQRENYTAILWLVADSAENLSLGLWTLARELRLAIDGKTADEVRQIVIQWLQTQVGWLLLVDNADDLKIVKPLLNKINETGHIALSTRASVTRPFAEPLPVEKMTEEEGVAFLCQRTGYAAEADTTELVHLLGGLPLALDQAAAYISESQMSFADYIDLYQTEGLKLLAERGTLFDDADHPEPIVTTWLLSFEKVQKESELAIELLRQCAFLHGDGILEEFFDDVPKKDFHEAMKEILKYSLLKRDNQRKLLSMHRLVQEVLRAQLSAEQQKQMIEQVVKLLVAGCPNDETDFMAWTKRRSEWLLNAREGERWSQQAQLQFKEMGTLLNNMGYYLKAIGDYPQALPLFQADLEISEHVLGKQHPLYATSLNNLAGLYNSQGEYEKALPLYQAALEIREHVLGKQHPDYAGSLNNLAELYRAQGEYEKALPLSQAASEIFGKVLGKQHPNYATSLNNLAFLYYSQGEYEKALPLYQAALEIVEHVLGKQHPSYAASLNNLAELYRAQGEYEKALPLYQEASEIFGKVLGKQHPNYAASLNNLALLYDSQGEYEKALPLYQAALEIREHVLGKQHPSYATSLNNLAGLYYSQGEYEKALPLYEEAVKIFVKVLGEKHPITQVVKENYETCRAAASKK